jgi:hypothetical protein
MIIYFVICVCNADVWYLIWHKMKFSFFFVFLFIILHSFHIIFEMFEFFTSVLGFLFVIFVQKEFQWNLLKYYVVFGFEFFKFLMILENH